MEEREKWEKEKKVLTFQRDEADYQRAMASVDNQILGIYPSIHLFIYSSIYIYLFISFFHLFLNLLTGINLFMYSFLYFFTPFT